MLKATRSGLRACSRCVVRQPSQTQQRRWLAGVATGAARLDPANTPAFHSQPGANHDDSLLRQLFDSPQTFKEFEPPSSRAVTGTSVGLFRNKYLTSPKGFILFANDTLEKAQKLVDKVLAASTVEEYKAVVRDMDRLSDLLCRVLDVSDFVRVTHPDGRIQEASSQAWALVYQYMNQLNTTTGLSEQLGKALANPEVMSSWTEEERTVGELLQQDFMKSAIHLPEGSRNRFVEISQQISELGSVFVEDMTPEQDRIVFPSSRFRGMDPHIAQSYISRGTMYLPTMSPEAAIALRSVHDEDTRKAIYLATRTASNRSVKILETMLRLRSELANLSGFENYGQLALRDRMMAKTPESVHQFLLALAKHNVPRVEKEIADLMQAKGQNIHASTATDLHPWDKDYYMASIRWEMRSRRRGNDILSSYFSLGTVMQGLSRLFTRLYGIRLVPRDTLPGETWHTDVRRLDVVSDTDGHVAVLYCDLFHRADKLPNPAHFTVRCSREISEQEIHEAAQAISNRREEASADAAISEANDGMHVSKQAGTVKQLPTIALTLFHEMGHAIHSVLARTSLQNVAGTRCATDFAELPSTLMEHFCADPTVLQMFARHYETDEPLPYELVSERLQVLKRFEASDRENQIIMAMLDQQYHASRPGQANFDSTEIYHNLQRTYGKLPPDAAGTRWQGYLFDQVLSERVWRVVFSAGQDGAALDRANGERLKENLLKWGKSRPLERLIRGDEKAMRLVGSWGIKDDGQAR
ncbi:mitochondrial intermediate peptidase [Apiospora kogelbergensis]|uniref:mitochondrial intermediate peptidase n=1 Tax=Apiospora kogelbergensis TaxID=1337665 RepID=UPI00312E47C8